ncbi:malonyl-CoA synthase [Caenispirillum salinarum]|uniref:malonate--CoA ligase n=1 Tax=Caenispirillum salinarum TaxID=859058 RepID=UPI003850905A
MTNLYQHFRAGWSDPARPLMHTDDGRTATYGDLDGHTAAFGAALKAAGVNKGDRVAVQVEKTPEAVFLYLACQRVGAVYLPLNTAYTLSELEYFLGDAEPVAMICRPKDEADIGGLCQRLGVANVFTLGTGEGSLLDAVAKADTGGFTDEEVGEDDLAAILYTSGTTGRSKGAMLTRRGLQSNAEALAEAWRFTADDVLLHALPIFHIHGLFVAINTVLASGASMIFQARFDPAAVIRALPRATTMMGVPTFYVRLLAEDSFTRDVAGHMRLFVSGSAPLLEETFRAFEARTGHRILERYGMTETGMNASNPYDGERRPGTVGFPLPGVAIRAAAEDGTVLGRDEVGVLEVKGPNVFAGYWRMPEKTAEEFRPDGWFITGDVGKIDAEGYVHIVGRSKDMIISGGYNVYPKEIETVIDDMDGIGESAVIGVPHSDFGEGVVAVVVPEGDAPPAEADIIAAARQHLAGYKAPKKVFFVDALPRNTMGKVQKAELRKRFAGAFDQ